MLILTIGEVKDLAYFCGLILTQECIDDKKDDDVEVSIEECPEKEILDEDDGSVKHYKKIAYSTDYPEEGVFPLGNELN